MTSPLNYRKQRMFPQDILDDLDRRLRALEDKRVERDVTLYGRAYLVDGQYVSPDRIVVIAAPTGSCRLGENCVCGGDLPSVREGCPQWMKK